MIKEKRSKKISNQNPNQLSFDFNEKDSPIAVQLPRTKITTSKTHSDTKRRLAIRLAEG